MDKRETTDLDSLNRDVVRFEELVQICPNGIAFCREGTILNANAALAGLLRRSHGSLVGVSRASLFQVEEREAIERKLGVLLSQDLGHESTCRAALIRDDHSIIHVDASIRRLEHSAADCVVVFRPLAVFKNSSSMNSEALLHQAHMLRMGVFGELAASLVHALGQPLTAANGAREILLDETGKLRVDENNARAAEIFLASMNDFAGRFKRIWDFVRVRKPTLAVVGVNSICEDAIDLVQQSANHAGVVINFSAEDKLTATVDSSLVQLIVVSLLQRSVLALTAEVKSVRKIELTTTSGDEGFISVDILHHGIPLSHEERNGDQHHLDETPNENLTLATCRLIAEENCGVLSVKPEATAIRYQLVLPT